MHGHACWPCVLQTSTARARYVGMDEQTVVMPPQKRSCMGQPWTSAMELHTCYQIGSFWFCALAAHQCPTCTANAAM